MKKIIFLFIVFSTFLLISRQCFAQVDHPIIRDSFPVGSYWYQGKDSALWVTFPAKSGDTAGWWVTLPSIGQSWAIEGTDDYKKKYDSVAALLKVRNYQIARIKYYLHICIKHPKNDKFLKGWIARVLN